MPVEHDRGTIPPPYPLAMVISDAIWHDPGTGKRTILGCFSVIFARTFPAVHGMMAVYVAVTNGRGRVPIALQVVGAIDDEDEEATLFRGEGEVEFPDPRAVVELDFHLQNVTFPREGEYRFQLFAGNEFLMERRLVVVQVPEVQS
jgi:hypothetical protein